MKRDDHLPGVLPRRLFLGLALSLGLTVFLGLVNSAAPSWADVYELRTYTTHEGKLGNLDARFRDHTIRIFNRHGMQSVAYWHPADEPDCRDTLIYILRPKSRDAAAASWKAFGGDPDWQKVARESQQDGKFLRERPEATFLKATDYSAIQ